MSIDVQVSFILATYNRGSILLHTLERIDACGLPRRCYEIWVVDNASTDSTAARVSRHRPDVKLLPLDHNRGSCAKALAVPRASGKFIVFLDDDSFPLDDCVQQMIEYFDADDALAAAGFVTFLPDGRQECSALPNVFIGCGVGLRKSALLEVGGLDLSYFMQAEEYDLSFRLIQAGYKVQTFENLYVLHEKTQTARRPTRQTYYDARNNFTLALNYLPKPWLHEFMCDWRQRYRWLAEDLDAGGEYQDGHTLGLLRGWWRRLTRPDARLGEQAMNTLFGYQAIREKMRQLRGQGIAQLLFADLGKSIYAYYRAAIASGLDIVAVMDDGFAANGRSYRGIPLLTYAEGLSLPADGVVISNASPVHARRAQWRLRHSTALPIFRWHSHFQPLRRPNAVPVSS